MSESHAYTRAARVADHPPIRQARQAEQTGATQQGAGLTPTQSMILQLQRTAGNAAVNALLRQYAQGKQAASADGVRGRQSPTVQRRAGTPVSVQRWPTTTPNLDWSQTQSIGALPSGQPVLFFHDHSGPPVVVKAEDAPYGLTLFSDVIHQQVHGTPTVTTRDGTSSKSTLLRLIADPSKSDASWDAAGQKCKPEDFTGATPADRARDSMVKTFTKLPKIQIMAALTSESGRKLAAKDSDPAKMGPGGYRQLFDDMAVVNKLGQLSAADYFLENGDRVQMNFGNFMVEANNALTLIDNMDVAAKNLWSDADPVGPKNKIKELAPSKQDAMVKKLAANIVTEVKYEAAADQRTNAEASIKAWLQEQSGAGTREEAIKSALGTGIAQGRARIIKLYATGKTGKAGRLAKKGAERAYKMDLKAGDRQAGGISYWERLKARARYLQKLT
ncbi:MAG: hypothetical protein ACRDGS_05320 [Chloroflexota bacterium]